MFLKLIISFFHYFWYPKLRSVAQKEWKNTHIYFFYLTTVDFYAKTFPILYPCFENSTTGNAIIYRPDRQWVGFSMGQMVMWGGGGIICPLIEKGLTNLPKFEWYNTPLAPSGLGMCMTVVQQTIKLGETQRFSPSARQQVPRNQHWDTIVQSRRKVWKSGGRGAC